MPELLLGAGRDHKKRYWNESLGVSREWNGLRTLDVEPSTNPDVLWDLNDCPSPFDNNTFSEIHAYEVIEHLGSQGDFPAFFSPFYEAWRILEPGGLFVFTCPKYDTVWAWGDPGHTRIINDGSVVFLDQQEYVKQTVAMTDYRHWWKGDFECVVNAYTEEHYLAVLKARK